MEGIVFLSYRRSDSESAAGRLFDALRKRLGRDRVFRDVKAIRPGEDFEQALRNALSNAATLIAVIGPRWLTLTDSNGRPRLAAEDDILRAEIRTALQNKLRVIPVLVEGATMPSPTSLPDDIKALARVQAHELSDRHWEEDVDELVNALRYSQGAGRRAWTRQLIVLVTVSIVGLAGLGLWWTTQSDAGSDQTGRTPSVQTPPVTDKKPEEPKIPEPTVRNPPSAGQSQSAATGRADSSPLNLIRNGGFEELDDAGQPTEWSPMKWNASGTATVAAEAHTGARSVRLQSTSTNHVAWKQMIRVVPRTDYVLTGWIKTRDVKQADERVVGASLGVLEFYATSPGVLGTNIWTLQKLEFNSGDLVRPSRCHAGWAISRQRPSEKSGVTT